MHLDHFPLACFQPPGPGIYIILIFKPEMTGSQATVCMNILQKVLPTVNSFLFSLTYLPSPAPPSLT